MSFHYKDVSAWLQPGDDAAPSYGIMSYEYTATTDNALSVSLGEEVTILQTGPDWLRVVGRAGTGFVPASYVKLVRPARSRSRS